MLTQAELNALTQLLQRTPMTQAEALWTRELLRRLQSLLQPAQKREEQDGDESPDQS